MKWTFLKKVVKVLGAVQKVKNTITKLFYKKKKDKTEEQIRQDIINLQKELSKKQQKVIKDIKKTKKYLEPKEIKQKYVQVELYAIGRYKGTRTIFYEDDKYLLVNVPKEFYLINVNKFTKLQDTKLIKRYINLNEKDIVFNVNSGLADATENKTFIEVNGKREYMDLEKVKEVLDL